MPHEPTGKFVNSIEDKLAKWGVVKFTQLKSNFSERVIIVNTIGQLADLYQYANAAYVGGSFKQGVHNVMEPAIYGIPVVFGPVHKNSYEAIQLAKCEGGIIIEDEIQANETLEKLISDNSYKEKAGQKAFSMAQNNTGATDKIINNWRSIFQQNEN